MKGSSGFERRTAAYVTTAMLAWFAANALAGGFVCGDGLVGPNESCDDGNAVAGDGCSESCIIENSFECSAPYLPLGESVLEDGNFEQGPFSGAWDESSSANDNLVICSVNDCPEYEQFGARQGAFWARFGSLFARDNSLIKQAVVIGDSERWLDFDLLLPVCGSNADFFQVIIDNQVVFEVRGGDALCGRSSYQKQLIDLETAPGGPYNDDNKHEFVIVSQTFFQTDTPTVFQIDDLRIAKQVGNPSPSLCELDDFTLRYDDFDPGVMGNLGDLGISTFELGDPVPWGTTDDGVCGTGQVPPGNFTGGQGEAACLDATAAGNASILSFFCTDAIDFSTAIFSNLTFQLNVQLGQQTANDFFSVFVGIDPPDDGTIGGYQIVYNADGSVGDFGEPNGEEIFVDLSILDGEPEGYVCFGFGSETALYAQVDNVDVSFFDCTDDNDKDKLLSCYDNCIGVENNDQTDSDGDGYGNACDADINRESVARVPAGNGNDCVVNFPDLGVLRNAFFATPADLNWNPDADFNNDDKINAQDLGRMKELFFMMPGPSGETSACEMAP